MENKGNKHSRDKTIKKVENKDTGKKNVQPGKEPWKCSTCDVEFATAEALGTHVWQHNKKYASARKKCFTPYKGH